MAAPVFALSTLNCTLATPTSSVAVAVKFVVPEIVAPETGEVTETIGAVVSAAVVNVRSPLATVLFAASVECTR
jgi:hypothetical protein